MNRLKTSIEYFCSSIGLITKKQCETLVNLRKIANQLIKRLYNNLLDYKKLYDEIQKQRGFRDINKVKILIQSFENIINSDKVMNIIYKKLNDKVYVTHELYGVYYDHELIKLLNKIHKDYCENKYYDIKHLYNRPCNEALEVITKTSIYNEELEKKNSEIEDLLLHLTKELTKSNIILKTRENFIKEKSINITTDLNADYYLLEFLYDEKEDDYSIYFNKYDNYSKTLEETNSYIYLDDLEHNEDIDGLIEDLEKQLENIDEEERESYVNDRYSSLLKLKKHIDEFNSKSGLLFTKYIEHISYCFGEKDVNCTNKYILFDNKNDNVVLSFYIDNQNMIYNLCKTSNSIYRHLKFSELLKEFLKLKQKTYYTYLNYDEVNYDKVVALLIRSGFSIKGSSTLPNEFILNDYSKNKRYLLFMYNPKKKINVSSLNTENLLAISNNIKEYEKKLNVNNYQLKNISIRKILKYVYSWNKEISGSFTQINKKSNIDILENLDENMFLNNGQEFMYINDVDLTQKCNVSIMNYDIVNYHTHPLFCYVNVPVYKKTDIPAYRKLNPPSRPDITTYITSLLPETINKLFKCHLIFSVECVYVIQMHPYWVEKFRKQDTFNIFFKKYLLFLIEKFKTFDITFEAVRNPKKIIDLLYFYNNKFNFNELSKDTTHKNQPSLFEHPKDITTEEEIRKWYKQKYYSNDLDRNMNLFIFSIIPYNWRNESELSKLEFKDTTLHMLNFLKENNNEVSKVTQYAIDNLSEDNLMIPYYFM